MKVIGAGFARTGTLSLKAALDRLGFGPCYHMLELIRGQDRLPLWHAAAAGETPDWAALFAGYGSAVDWPACYFWRDLAAAYPKAKIILTVRDPDAWYDSHAELFRQMRARRADIAEPARVAGIGALIRRLLIEATFQDRLAERDHCIEVFTRHNEVVRASLPPERLLVLDVRQGWEPLCAFLGVPVPAEPFPHLNDGDAVLGNIRAALERPSHPGPCLEPGLKVLPA